MPEAWPHKFDPEIKSKKYYSRKFQIIRIQKYESKKMILEIWPRILTAKTCLE